MTSITYARLPCPWSKETQSDAHFEDKSLHEGRTRSFAHVRGNWACYAYVECLYAPLALVSPLISVGSLYLKGVICYIWMFK